ncbi:MAG: hypothetical protein WAL22_08620 [Solirubrobacteraceae bacterium]
MQVRLARHTNRLANPYRDRSGLTFEDPDGVRVVIAAGGWPN